MRDVVARYLESAGFLVSTAATGDDALAAVRSGSPDLVILDVMLPGRDGLSVLHDLRRSGEIPVILLTARDAELDRIAGLELGADDYVTKPFSARELVARVKTVLRRTAGTTGDAIVVDGLTIDPRSREVTVDGAVVALTRLEFDLLAFLAAAPRQVFTRAQLLEGVWASSEDWQDPSTVTTHIRRLRKKVERDPDAPRWVVTAFGVGYRFEP